MCRLVPASGRWLPAPDCTSRKNIWLRYLSEIVHLSRYAVFIFDCHLVTRSWVVGWTQSTSSLVWLSASSSVLVRVLARWRAVTFRNIIRFTKVLVRWQRPTFRNIIRLARVLAQWRRSDRDLPFRSVIMLVRVTGLMTKVYHQVSQSNWLDGRSLGEGLSKTPDKRSAKDSLIHR